MSDLQAAVQDMNAARARAPGGHRDALTQDDGLMQGAQEWADTMARTQQFRHSGAPGLGENIAFFSGVAGGQLRASVGMWLAEKSKYHGEKVGESGRDGGFQAWGHYTQIVWPSTERVGLAQATASNGNIYVCGRYSPPGNFMGQSATSGLDPNQVVSGGSQTYAVQAGDTFFLIARRFGISVQAIEAANPGVDPTKLRIGQVINIPLGGPQPPASQTYIIQAGDTFFAIARKFGISVEAIQAANPGVDANKLRIGQVINVPAARLQKL